MHSWGQRTLGFHTSSFIEQFLGEDVLGDEDDSTAKSAKDAEDIA